MLLQSNLRQGKILSQSEKLPYGFCEILDNITLKTPGQEFFSIVIGGHEGGQ